MQLPLRLALVWLYALLLSACATQAPIETADLGWEQRRTQLAALANWQLEGKLALRTPKQSDSASLSWTQAGDRAEVHLSGPLGAGSTALSSDGRQLSVRQGEQRRDYDISSPQAIAASTGWDLPLKALPFWLRGIPVPETPVDAQQVNSNLLRHLSQAGWLVDYDDYQRFGSFLLPTRIQIRRDDTHARLIIRQWQPAEP